MKTRIPFYSYNFGDSLIAKTPTVVPTGAGPIAIIFAFDSIWIGCTNDGAVERYGLDGTLQARIVLGSYPAHVPQSLCAGAGSIWVTDTSANNLARIDPSTNTIIANIGVGVGPIHCVYDGKFIWTSNYSGGSVSKIDPQTNSVIGALAPVLLPSYRMVFDGKRLWVGGWSEGRVCGIDVITGAGLYATGISQPWGMCYDGQYVWVSSYGSSALYALNPETAGIVYSCSLETGAAPHDVLAVGSEIWIANSGKNHVQVVDALTCQVTRTLGVGNDPAGLAWDGASVWVTNALGNSIQRFQLKERS